MILTSEQSHQQGLKILNALYEYDDFMESIQTVVDLGCGDGLDLEWWATRTTRDDARTPLNIQCIGVDVLPQLAMAKKYPNITYQPINFEGTVHTPKNKKFDILWCNNSFQYCINPLETLAKWRSIASDNAMLILTIPQTTNIVLNNLEITQDSGCYYHYTLVNLMHMLAVTGWDCKSGYFLKEANDHWLRVIVYNSQTEPLPLTTSWYELVEKDLLPDSAAKSVMSHGYLKQQDLVLPWIDRNLHWFGKQ